MAETRSINPSPMAASFVLGRKLDSIPFSAYHILILGVLALVGFVEGYDLSLTQSLLVLAKAPLHLTESDIRWIAVGPTLMLCVGGFAFTAVADQWSRKAIIQIGVIATTFFTLLIPLVQNAEQLIIRHCQLKRPWYAARVGGAAARVGDLLCSPIVLLRSSRAGPEKGALGPLS